MSELFEDDDPAQNTPEFTVSELSGAIKRMIEGAFDHIQLRAELGRVSRPRSGHVYLDLKDDNAVIAGIIWKGVAARLTTPPEEGMEVVVTGRLTTFPGQSKYQIIIDDLKPAGAGALMAMLEARKAKLAAEGLFDPARKKPLPFLPQVIGVITSPSGAVIRDILHRLRDRFPRKVLLWPVAVQGAACANQVAAAIEGFNRLTPGGALPRPDLLIVARGGGSIEDLWGFNEEITARAAAASDIPLISAVGHETDTTLIDFVSDRRAPTPTAAAEMAVPVRADLLAELARKGARATTAQSKLLQMRGQRLRDLSRALPQPQRLLETPAQRLDTVSDRLPRALRSALSQHHLRLSRCSGQLRPSVLRQRVITNARTIAGLDSRRMPALMRIARLQSDTLRNWGARLAAQNPLADVTQQKRTLDQLVARLARAAQADRQNRGHQLERAGRMLDTLSYRATLARGFAVLRDGDQVVSSTKSAAKARSLSVEFADGIMDLNAPRSAPRSKKSDAGNGPEQGSLF